MTKTTQYEGGEEGAGMIRGTQNGGSQRMERW